MKEKEKLFFFQISENFPWTNTSQVYDSFQIKNLKITNDLGECRIRISRTQEWQDSQCEGVSCF